MPELQYKDIVEVQESGAVGTRAYLAQGYILLGTFQWMKDGGAGVVYAVGRTANTPHFNGREQTNARN